MLKQFLGFGTLPLELDCIQLQFPSKMTPSVGRCFFCLNSLLFSYSVDIIFLVSRKNNRSRWSFTVESFLFLVSQMLIIGIFQAVSWVCSFSFLFAAMADYLAWLCEMAGNIYFWTFPCYILYYIWFDFWCKEFSHHTGHKCASVLSTSSRLRMSENQTAETSLVCINVRSKRKQ